MRRFSHNSGTTIVELIVCSAILGGLMLIVALIFTKALKLRQRVETSHNIQRSLLASAGSLTRDLAESHVSSIRFDAAPQGVVFVSARDDSGAFNFDTGNQMEWHHYICYHIIDNGGRSELYKTVEDIPGAPLSPAPPLPASKTTSYFASSGLPTKLIGEDIVELSGTAGPSVTLFIRAERTIQDKDYSTEINTSVMPRH